MCIVPLHNNETHYSVYAYQINDTFFTVQNQKAVSANFTSKQKLHFDLAEQHYNVYAHQINQTWYSVLCLPDRFQVPVGVLGDRGVRLPMGEGVTFRLSS